MNAPLIAHFPLDASPDNVVGEAGVVFTNSGAAPQPVPGRFGQAYRFGESAVIAAPLDIDFTTYPRITITAWVKLAQEREDSGGYILSTGRASRAPALMFSNERLRGESAGRKPVLYEGDPIPPETWTFIAGVWDFEAHTLRLYNGEAAKTFTNPDLDVAKQSDRKRSQPELKRPDDDAAEPRRYVFIGARDFKAGRAAKDVAIDDVRIYAGTLDDNAIAAIRDGSATRVAGRDRIGETEKNLQAGGGTARADSRFDPRQIGEADTMPIDPVRHGPAAMGADEHSGDVERQTVVFDGTAGPGRTRYTLWTTGKLEPVEGRLEGHTVTINPDDTLDGTGRAARGYVGTAKDGYYVYGEIEKITLADPGAARVYVNGQLYSDVSKAVHSTPVSDTERHTVVIDGTAGPGRTRYTLRAAGRLEPVDGEIDGMAVTIDPDDTLDGTGRAARGYVGSARDGYYVYGDIDSITLTEPDAATVYVDGEVWDEERITRQQAMMPSGASTGDDSRAGEQTSATGRARGSGTLEVEQGERASTVPRVSIDTGDERLSGVSGASGSNRLKVDLRRYPMHTLRWYEESDRPCHVEILGYAPGVEPYEIAQASGEVCSGSGGNSRSRKSVGLNSQHAAVRSLAVCSNANTGGIGIGVTPNRYRLKGVELAGGVLTSGRFEPGTNFSNRAERPNCDTWRDAVSCPGDRVATGIVMHVSRNSPNNNYLITGMQLICRSFSD